MPERISFECETQFQGAWNPVLMIEQRDLADLVALVFHAAGTGDDPTPSLNEALAPYGISVSRSAGGGDERHA